MKKLIASLITGIAFVFSAGALSGCAFVNDSLNNAAQIEVLEEENKILKDQNAELKKQLASYKFAATFPNGVVNKSCILNNVEITRTEVKEDGAVFAVFIDGAETEVTINGGKYDAGKGSMYNIAVWASQSKVTINGGEFITGDDVEGGSNHSIYASDGATITITGGLFRSTGNSDWLINCQDGNGTIIITGGTFVNFNPADNICEGEHTNFVAEGYEVVSEQVGEDTYYKVVEKVEDPTPEAPEETPKEEEEVNPEF